MPSLPRCTTNSFLPFIALGLSLITSARSPTQCTMQGLPGEGVPGVNGIVRATVAWDPDGAGPATERLVVGGSFTVAGSILASCIAAWDPANGTFEALGTGLRSPLPANPSVHALTVLPNGDLVAAGLFATAGGVPCGNIARWDGTAWSPLGSGMNSTVSALTVLPDGELVAGGSFATAGGVSCSRIARWDGATWSPLDAGTNGTVSALTVLPSGDLVAGGAFGAAGGVSCSRLARWDGASWSPLGSGTSANVNALTVLPSGDLVAGGSFATAGGVLCSCIARWDGASWFPLGAGTNGVVNALVVLPSGDIVAGGSFTTAGGVSCIRMARWNGTVWSPLGAGTSGNVNAVSLLSSGDIVVGGLFVVAGGVACSNVARWDGTTWSPLAAGLGGVQTPHVDAVLAMPNGDLVIGGEFAAVGGAACLRIARWDGTTWFPLGAGMDGVVRALAVLPDGDLVSGGDFGIAGGVTCSHVARWDGATWVPLGTGMNSVVFALAVLPNGDLVAGGAFTTAGGVACGGIARWDGATWSPLGTGTDGAVYSLTVLPNGDLVAGGTFASAGGVLCNRIARWDGTTWSPLGSGMTPTVNPTVYSLATLTNGDVVAGGGFTVASGVVCSHIARWDGAAWWPLASGMDGTSLPQFPYVTALTALPDGGLVAGGLFIRAGGITTPHVAHWNGTTWSAMGTGADTIVRALAVLPNGEVAVGGDFKTLDGQVAIRLGRFAPTCPATSISYGAGCPSSGGSNLLTATTLPWVESTFHATGTGLPMTAIVIVATSVTPIAPGAAPLAALLPPHGVPGCDLLVTPDILEPIVTLTGTATSSLALPNTPPLVGTVFYQQMVPIEVDGLGNWVAITSTNSLQLTAGTF